MRAVPTSANVKYYCNIVKENSMKRKLIRVTEEIENECYAGKESLESVLDKTEHDILHCCQAVPVETMCRFVRLS